VRRAGDEGGEASPYGTLAHALARALVFSFTLTLTRVGLITAVFIVVFIVIRGGGRGVLVHDLSSLSLALISLAEPPDAFAQQVHS
jgi:hypothetical protein